MSYSIMWSVGMSLDALEKLVVERAFKFYRGNKTATASSLGIAIRTLDNKLAQYEQQDILEKERAENDDRNRAHQLARSRGQLPDNLGMHRSPHVYAHAGPRVESIANAAPQPPVPVQERKEVQAVLPEHAPKGSKPKGR